MILHSRYLQPDLLLQAANKTENLQPGGPFLMSIELKGSFLQHFSHCEWGESEGLETLDKQVKAQI